MQRTKWRHWNNKKTKERGKLLREDLICINEGSSHLHISHVPINSLRDGCVREIRLNFFFSRQNPSDEMLSNFDLDWIFSLYVGTLFLWSGTSHLNTLDVYPRFLADKCVLTLILDIFTTCTQVIPYFDFLMQNFRFCNGLYCLCIKKGVILHTTYFKGSPLSDSSGHVPMRISAGTLRMG